MDSSVSVYENLDSVQLIKAHKQSVWLCRVGTLALVVCLLAGIWVDWRFLPTALVALVVAVVFGMAMVSSADEIAERAAEIRRSLEEADRKAASDG